VRKFNIKSHRKPTQVVAKRSPKLSHVFTGSYDHFFLGPKNVSEGIFFLEKPFNTATFLYDQLFMSLGCQVAITRRHRAKNMAIITTYVLEYKVKSKIVIVFFFLTFFPFLTNTCPKVHLNKVLK